MARQAALRRHARTLADAAARQGDPAQVQQELEWFRAVLEDPQAGALLTSPAVPPARKTEAVRAVLDRAGVSTITTRLLVALAGHDRLGVVPALADAYRAVLQERANIVPAEVTTAVQLPAPAIEALERRLGEVTGKQVILETRVDPSIIGGVVARVGTTVFDGSITGQLARIRQKLVENV